MACKFLLTFLQNTSPGFRTRKAYYSQFIFVYPGWEGSVEDLHILRAVLDDPNQNFPQAPKGKYYLVDRDYTNTEGYIAPYPGTRYCLHEFRGASQMPQNAQELFNHRHMCLSNVIQRSFSMLKTRFPILESAPQYPFHVQRDLVIATCTLHNFMKREDGIHDWLFAACAEDVGPVEEPYGQEEEVVELLQLNSTPTDIVADSLRDSTHAQGHFGNQNECSIEFLFVKKQICVKLNLDWLLFRTDCRLNLHVKIHRADHL
ncbi:PREDICTED: uncharacterized protein LOC104737893 [Camelina sativa]|uniref:Uncharacterized protein LOC104737893 n=1 Tax=Camelina sativa TaxID=90675 RepID=A0ABM1QSW5_CAMSA|nr:PREDICTED: uncharacterized protein LOC104737893 [Camelina sativa]